MALNSNYVNFKNNLFEPREIRVDNKDYLYYLVVFNNLYELYDYLKSNPYINREIFRELASRKGPTNFAGMPYEQALEDLINLEDNFCFDFINLVKDVANAKTVGTSRYRTVQSVCGGHLDIPLYSAGSPLCYEVEERVKKPKFINVYSALSYSSGTSKYQLFNRAVVLISIISALEKEGYNINLNAFEMSKCGNEVLNHVIGIKKGNERTNLQALYKTSCKVEFLRRIIFALQETSGVENSWGGGYGKSCNEDFVRELLNIGPKDIYFGTPQELNIGGGDIVEDFHDCIEKLKLTDTFDISNIDKDFNEQVKKLIR